MLNEGLTAMAVGMVTVFGFLVVLMFVVFFLGKIVAYLNKIFPEEIKTAAAAVKTVCDDTDIAIAVAVAKLRN